jgi:hypothetical protein
MFCYLTSKYIEEYINEHPVNLMADDRGLLREKKRTPELGMGKFYDLLSQRGCLFTQETLFDYVTKEWADWYSGLSDREKLAVQVRFYRGFYPSGIDQLYCQGLLHESGAFSRISYNTALETSGVDLTAWTWLERPVHIALRVDTPTAARADQKRQATIETRDSITVLKDLSGRRVGGMAFYDPSDLRSVIIEGEWDQIAAQRSIDMR